MKINQLIKSSKVDKNAVEKILCHLLKTDSAELFLKKNEEIQLEISRDFKRIAREISGGLPLQYALNSAEFFGREFYVDEKVLIPRPESELLVLHAIQYLVSSNKYHVSEKLNIIDIGTGSGCIAISLFKELGAGSWGLEGNFYATDISPRALSIARKNVRTHRAKIKFLKSNLFSNQRLPKKFDLVLANMPYLKSDYSGLEYEPRPALDGGENGLGVIERLIKLLPEKLNSGGLAILEIDPSQKNKISQFAKSMCLQIVFKKDLCSRNRLALISSSLPTSP